MVISNLILKWTYYLETHGCIISKRVGGSGRWYYLETLCRHYLETLVGTLVALGEYWAKIVAVAFLWPARRRILDEKTILAFWYRVDKDGPVPTHYPELGPCWIWTGTLKRSKYMTYGQFRFEGTMQLAHQVAWQIVVGSLDRTKQLCHKCDNSLCVNPRHMYQGTAQDNVDDKFNKKRHRY